MNAPTAIALVVSLAGLVSAYLGGFFQSNPLLVLVLVGVAKVIMALLGPLFSSASAK